MKIWPVVLVGMLALQALPAFSGEVQEKIYKMDEVLLTASPEKISKYVQNVIEEQEVARPTSGGSVLDILTNSGLSEALWQIWEKNLPRRKINSWDFCLSGVFSKENRMRLP